jgi:exodeoxyribonuclease V alpha subunit
LFFFVYVFFEKLAQVTKQKATTLHRLLEYDPLIEGFKRNSSNRLIGGLFLVDEASMIDVELASAFFSAVPDRAVVVLVGDVDQLPAVGPGSVLQDLVSQLPSVRLDRNFRQLEESSHIVRAAHAMLKGQMIQLMPYNVGSGLESFDQFVGESDLRFMAADSPESILNGVVGVMEDLKFRFGIDPVEDVQVLTAMRKGPLGSRAFNTVLQNKFNNDAPTDQAFSSETSGVYSFRQNDKVEHVLCFCLFEKRTRFR